MYVCTSAYMSIYSLVLLSVILLPFFLFALPYIFITPCSYINCVTFLSMLGNPPYISFYLPLFLFILFSLVLPSTVSCFPHSHIFPHYLFLLFRHPLPPFLTFFTSHLHHSHNVFLSHSFIPHPYLPLSLTSSSLPSFILSSVIPSLSPSLH